MAAITPAGAGGITGDHRLFSRALQDAAIVQKAWLETGAAYERFDGGRDAAGFVTVVFRLGRDVETGLLAGVLDRRREPGATLYGRPETVDAAGVSDVTLYGKYRILRSPIEIGAGAAATLPTAEESRDLGPGVIRYEAFAGIRRTWPGLSLIASAGGQEAGGRGGPSGDAAGRASFTGGVGLLVPLALDWVFAGELTSRGALFERDGTDTRLLAGLDWRPTANIVLRGAAGIGLSDAAPDRVAQLSGAFHF